MYVSLINEFDCIIIQFKWVNHNKNAKKGTFIFWPQDEILS